MGLDCNQSRAEPIKRGSPYLGHRWLGAVSRACGIPCLAEAVWKVQEPTALRDLRIWQGTAILKFTFNFFHIIAHKNFQDQEKCQLNWIFLFPFPTSRPGVILQSNLWKDTVVFSYILGFTVNWGNVCARMLTKVYMPVLKWERQSSRDPEGSTNNRQLALPSRDLLSGRQEDIIITQGGINTVL